MARTPIEFTLYGADDEPLDTYGRARVPAEFLEQALELAELLDGVKNPSEIKESLPTIYQFVADFYGGKFTAQEVGKGSEFSEIITLITAVVNRAAELMPGTPNPTNGAKAGKPSRTPRVTAATGKKAKRAAGS